MSTQNLNFQWRNGLLLLRGDQYRGAYDGIVDWQRDIWSGVAEDLDGIPFTGSFRITRMGRWFDLAEEAACWLLAKAAGLPVAPYAGFIVPKLWQIKPALTYCTFGDLAADESWVVFFTSGDQEYPSTRYGQRDIIATLLSRPDAEQQWRMVYPQIVHWVRKLDGSKDHECSGRVLAAYDALAHRVFGAPQPLPLAA